MAGKLVISWPRTWSEIWVPLSKAACAPKDLFSELVRAVAIRPLPPEPPPPPPAEAFDPNGELVHVAAIKALELYRKQETEYHHLRDRYETAVAGSGARNYFRSTIADIRSERDAVETLEGAWGALESFEEPSLNYRYQVLVRSFLLRYSVRYELREPFSLHATLPGLFSRLMAEIKSLSTEDEHLAELFAEFEEAFSDLRTNRSSARMKTCLQKQFNLLEAFAGRCPGVTGQTLGAMCDQLDWPHATIKEVGKKLYGFRSSYPGLGHAGQPQGVLRQVGMKDFVSISLMLAAFTPYVAHGLDAECCYSADGL